MKKSNSSINIPLTMYNSQIEHEEEANRKIAEEAIKKNLDKEEALKRKELRSEGYSEENIDKIIEIARKKATEEGLKTFNEKVNEKAEDTIRRHTV